MRIEIAFLRINIWLLFLLLQITQLTNAQTSFSDTAVDNLMKKYEYQGAVELIRQKLGQTQKSEHAKKLYYNTKMAHAYYRLMNVDSAIQYAIETKEWKEICTDSGLIVDAIRVLASVSNLSGDLNAALFYNDQLMRYANFHQDTLMKRNALTMFGTILSENKRYDEALIYFNDAFKLSISMRDTMSYPVIFYNLGLTYLYLNIDSSMVHLFQALPYAVRNNNKKVQLKIYSALADCFLAKKDSAQYKYYLVRANEIAAEIGNPIMIAYGYADLMRFDLSNKNFNGALEYGKSIGLILQKSPYPILQNDIDSMMYIAYRGLNDRENALIYLEKHLIDKSKLLNLNQEKSLNLMHLKYKTAEKNLVIANQKLELIEKKNKFTYFIFLPVILILCLASLFLYWLKRRKFISEIFKKEKYLTSHLQETQDWMKIKEENENQKLNDNNNELIKNNSINSLKNNQLYCELRDTFEKQKLYLIPDINLNSVVKILGTNKRYLYEALSKSSDDNFRNFVNRYRINEAKLIIEQKIKNKEPLVIPDIWASTGFNSGASFYRAFNLITGLTPSEYIRELEKYLNASKNL